MALLVIRAESYGQSNEKANYDSVFTTQSHILDDALQNCAPATDVTLLTLVTLITSIKKKANYDLRTFKLLLTPIIEKEIFLKQEGSALGDTKALDKMEVYLIHCSIILYSQANLVEGKFSIPSDAVIQAKQVFLTGLFSTPLNYPSVLPHFMIHAPSLSSLPLFHPL